MALNSSCLSPQSLFKEHRFHNENKKALYNFHTSLMQASTNARQQGARLAVHYGYGMKMVAVMCCVSG